MSWLHDKAEEGKQYQKLIDLLRDCRKSLLEACEYELVERLDAYLRNPL